MSGLPLAEAKAKCTELTSRLHGAFTRGSLRKARLGEALVLLCFSSTGNVFPTADVEVLGIGEQGQITLAVSLSRAR